MITNCGVSLHKNTQQAGLAEFWIYMDDGLPEDGRLTVGAVALVHSPDKIKRKEGNLTSSEPTPHNLFQLRLSSCLTQIYTGHGNELQVFNL